MSTHGVMKILSTYFIPITKKNIIPEMTWSIENNCILCSAVILVIVVYDIFPRHQDLIVTTIKPVLSTIRDILFSDHFHRLPALSFQLSMSCTTLPSGGGLFSNDVDSIILRHILAVQFGTHDHDFCAGSRLRPQVYFSLCFRSCYFYFKIFPTISVN